jgi:hypothetical protein
MCVSLVVLYEHCLYILFQKTMEGVNKKARFSPLSADSSYSEMVVDEAVSDIEVENPEQPADTNRLEHDNGGGKVHREAQKRFREIINVANKNWDTNVAAVGSSPNHEIVDIHSRMKVVLEGLSRGTTGVWPDIQLGLSDKFLAGRFFGGDSNRSVFYLREGGDVTNISHNESLITFSGVGLNTLLKEGPKLVKYAADLESEFKSRDSGEGSHNNPLPAKQQKITVDELLESGIKKVVILTPYYFKNDGKVMFNFKVTTSSYPCKVKQPTWGSDVEKGITLSANTFRNLIEVIIPLFKKYEFQNEIMLVCLKADVEMCQQRALDFDMGGESV